MSRTHRITAALAATGALALAAPAADAVRPAGGSFFNGSSANGGHFIKTRYGIEHLKFFCKDYRYDVVELVTVRRDGHFYYKGRGDKYEPAGARRGTHWTIKLSGRTLSRDRVRIKRTIEGCGTATVTLRRERN